MNRMDEIREKIKDYTDRYGTWGTDDITYLLSTIDERDKTIAHISTQLSFVAELKQRAEAAEQTLIMAEEEWLTSQSMCKDCRDKYELRIKELERRIELMQGDDYKAFNVACVEKDDRIKELESALNNHKDRITDLEEALKEEIDKADAALSIAREGLEDISDGGTGCATCENLHFKAELTLDRMKKDA